MKSSGRSVGKIGRELGVVEIEKAGVEASRLAVDDVEDLHLLALSQPDEAHEGQLNVQVSKEAEPVLTIDLRQELSSVGFQLKLHEPIVTLSDAPRPIARGLRLNVSGIVALASCWM